MSKLYFRRRDGMYTESDVIRSDTTQIGRRLLARFHFESAYELDRVRFDPLPESGIYRIFSARWRVLSAASFEINHDAVELRTLVAAIGGVRLPIADPAALEFWSYDDDPQVELRLPESMAGAGAPVTLEIEWSQDPMTTAEATELAVRILGSEPETFIEQLRSARHEDLAWRQIAIAFCLDEEAFLRLRQLPLDTQRLASVVQALRIRQRELHGDQDALCGQIESAKQDLVQHIESSQRQRDEMNERAHASDLQLQSVRAEFTSSQTVVEHRQQETDQMLSRMSDQLYVMHRLLAELGVPWHQRFARRVQTLAIPLGQMLRTVRRNFAAMLDVCRTRRFGLVGEGDLETESAEDEIVSWRATGDDPRFKLELSRSVTLSSGWYLVKMEIAPTGDAQLLNPMFYADYGMGMSEATRVLCSLDPENLQQTLLIKLHGDAVALRFDPSTQPCEFRAGKVSFRKLTRMEAFYRLSSPVLRELLRSPSQIRHVLRDALSAFSAGGAAEVESRLRNLHESRSRDAGYSSWVAHFDVLDETDHANLAIAAQKVANGPKFSLVVPVYNTPEQWLRRCLDSVFAQAYENWELCIADDASTSPHVRSLLSEYEQRDKRVHVAYRDTNGHISAASNSALEFATGDYVVLLDHDDEIPAHALYMVAERLQRQPRLKLIYSDEDKIDERGQRYDPYFKPDWNPDLFHGQNFVCHLGVYSTELVRQVGGFRLGYEGSQDFDLALRCIERIDPDQIGHIPHVLYHWRSVAGSTALAGNEKDYTQAASLRALRDHFDRTGCGISIEPGKNGYFRPRHPLPATRPSVCLIVPTRDRVNLLKTCVQSTLAVTDYPNFEILIVDNQSSEAATFAYFESLALEPRVRVVHFDAPFNFSAINNFAAEHVDSDLIGLVNNDIEVIHADWLSEMVSHAIRPEIGAVGCKLYYPDGRLQHAGVIVGLGGVAGHAYQRKPGDFPGQMGRAHLLQEMSSVTAACLLVRREVFEAVGGLDVGLKIAFNDIDFCLRLLSLGLSNIWTPFAELVHHESASRGYEDSPEKIARFNDEIRFMQTRWGAALDSDPAYNPNLTLIGEAFELSWPPRARYPFRVLGE
ncbi:MAG: glycosyltransferase family 2 protein [Tahibacter sp.]